MVTKKQLQAQLDKALNDKEWFMDLANQRGKQLEKLEMNRFYGCNSQDVKIEKLSKDNKVLTDLCKAQAAFIHQGYLNASGNNDRH